MLRDGVVGWADFDFQRRKGPYMVALAISTEKKHVHLEALQRLFPGALRENEPEARLQSLDADLGGNAAMDQLVNYINAENLLADARQKLEQKHLHLGKILGAGSLAMVFTLLDDYGKELEGSVARIEIGNFGKTLESPLIAQTLLQVEAEGMCQDKPYIYESSRGLEETPGQEMELKLSIKVLPRGKAYTRVKPSQYASFDDEMKLNGYGATKRELVIGNVLRTLGYMSTQGDVTALVPTYSEHAERATEPPITVGDMPYVSVRLPMLKAVHDITPLKEEGGFLAFPTVDGKDVIRVNGQPLLLLTDTSSGNEFITLGNPAEEYLQALPAALCNLKELDAATRDLADETPEQFKKFRDDNLARGSTTEKPAIDDAIGAIAGRYLAIIDELKGAGVESAHITTPAFVTNHTNMAATHITPSAPALPLSK